MVVLMLLLFLFFSYWLRPLDQPLAQHTRTSTSSLALDEHHHSQPLTHSRNPRTPTKAKNDERCPHGLTLDGWLFAVVGGQPLSRVSSPCLFVLAFLLPLAFPMLGGGCVFATRSHSIVRRARDEQRQGVDGWRGARGQAAAEKKDSSSS